jgi:hypothetical protein
MEDSLMSEDRKQPGAVFWCIVAVVAIAILYPFSIGPVVWLEDHDCLPEILESPISVVYWPLSWIDDEGPDVLKESLEWYVSLWQRP